MAEDMFEDKELEDPTLLDMYDEILKYCGLKTDRKGIVSTDLGYMGPDHEDKDYNVHVGDKTLCLPSHENLQCAHKKGMIVFHPFHEQINTRESEVLTMLRRGLITRINYTVMVLGRTLLEIAGNPEMQQNIPRSLRPMLGEIGEVDSQAHVHWVDTMGKILAKTSMTALVDLYVKRNGMFNNKPAPWVTILSFELEKHLSRPEVRLKKKDIESFMRAYEQIFPGFEEPGAYGYASTSIEIPRLDSIIQGSMLVTSRLNDVIKALEPYLPYAGKMFFNTRFSEYLYDLSYFRKEMLMIPPQKGNQGHAEVKQEEATESNEDSANFLPAPPAPQQVQAQPNQLPAAQFVQQPAAMQAAPQAQMQPYQQQPNMMAPVQAQPVQAVQQQQEPGLATTQSGKLDFKSVERANPMVTAAGLVQTPLNMWAQAQQMQQQGVPMVDPRTGATYFAPAPQMQPQMAPMVPGAYPAMAAVPQIPLDAWGRPMAPQAGMMPGAYPAAVPAGVPGMYGQQATIDAWGRPVGRPPAQPAYPAGHVGRSLGRV